MLDGDLAGRRVNPAHLARRARLLRLRSNRIKRSQRNGCRQSSQTLSIRKTHKLNSQLIRFKHNAKPRNKLVRRHTLLPIAPLPPSRHPPCSVPDSLHRRFLHAVLHLHVFLFIPSFNLLCPPFQPPLPSSPFPFSSFPSLFLFSVFLSSFFL